MRFWVVVCDALRDYDPTSLCNYYVYVLQAELCI